VARVLIVGGGCRGRALASELIGDGHALRITTRAERGRDPIEALGAECWVGTPDRLQTLRGALEGVTVACWALATASGEPDSLAALHTTRLELFLTQAIDTTVRGLLYEAAGEGRRGEDITRSITARNKIPVAWLREDALAVDAWVAAARGAVTGFLQAT
jgi:nucleoside-diphosphate-sugar epimerase